MKRSALLQSVYQAPVSRSMTRFATVLCAAATLAFTALWPAHAGAVSASETGVWIDDTGKGAVDISPCGKKLCGRIFWLQEPRDAKGKPLTDGYNPEAAKRSQPICGLQVIGALERQGDGTWDAGWVYDPKVGSSYDVSIALKDANHLVVTGEAVSQFISQEFGW